MDVRKPIFDVIKSTLKNAPFSTRQVQEIDDLLDRLKVPSGTLSKPANEPAWITAGRAKIGEREIVGPRHNSWIARGWAKLGAGWYKDDETPWCGFFVADCLNEAGLPYPKNYPAAASFKTHGTTCLPRLGAIGVKSRKGGNHVFFIVGQTPDGLFFKVLEGNANNMVRIGDIRKTDVDSIRWPAGAALPLTVFLPVIAAGTTSGSEA